MVHFSADLPHRNRKTAIQDATEELLHAWTTLPSPQVAKKKSEMYKPNSRTLRLRLAARIERRTADSRGFHLAAQAFIGRFLPRC